MAAREIRRPLPDDINTQHHRRSLLGTQLDPSHTRWVTAVCNNGRDRARLMFGFHCRKRPRDPVCDPRQKRGQKRLTDFLDDLHGLILRVAGRGGVQLSPNLGLRTILANE